MAKSGEHRFVLYQLFQEWRRRVRYAPDVMFKPEYFLAWMTVVGKRGGFADMDVARSMYVEHSNKQDLDPTLIESLVERLGGEIPQTLEPGWIRYVEEDRKTDADGTDPRPE